jgi:8-oxo-dGTP pyrophosphatase MutT (NUDIX family)
LEVRILAHVGPIQYFFVQSGHRIHKTVHYYLMEPTGGGDLSQHDHEFDDVKWFGAAEAEAIMSFPTEREIVVKALAMPEAA